MSSADVGSGRQSVPLEDGGLFDEGEYLVRNPDVADGIRRGEFESGAAHFRLFGATEGRDLPLRAWWEREYLAANADVARAVARRGFADGRDHYARFGFREDRDVVVPLAVQLRPGMPVVQDLRIEADPLSGCSLRLLVGASPGKGAIGLRLSPRPPEHPAACEGGEGSERSAVIALSEFYDDRDYDWMFRPVAVSKPAWWQLEITLVRAPWRGRVTVRARRTGEWPAHLGRASGAGLPRSPKRFIEVTPRYSPFVAPAPKGLSYSPATRCNLNCTHCVSRVTRKRFRTLGNEMFGRFVPYVRSSGLPWGVISDYAGDPLFTESTQGGVLEFLESLGTNVYITTNGNVMTPELAERLMRPPYDQICFSIDGARAETYAAIRKGARPLHEVLENLRLVVATRRRFGLGKRPRILINVVLMRRNVAELCEFVDMAIITGADVVNAVHMISMTDDMEAESLWHHRALYNAMRRRALDYARRKNVWLRLPPAFEDRPPATGHTFCAEPWRSVSVLGNGDVQACCLPESVMGNLHEETLEQIWNGELYRSLRARVNSDRSPEMCRHCPIMRVEHNPTSYVYNRVRRRWRTLREELREESAGTAGASFGSRGVARRHGGW
jgi:radical SAM protein with 4Fe4S-binding SPASM domain